MRSPLSGVAAPLVLAAVIGCVASSAVADEAPIALSVADFVTGNSHTGGIQEAIDALPREGGVVQIPAGVYRLRQSIRVRSGVTLAGAGHETILRKTERAGSALAQRAAAEDRSLHVVDAAEFQAGDQLGIFDRTTVGWLHSRAIIAGIRGNELLLDRRVARDFDPAENAAVVNYFSAITGVDVARVTIKDLFIDGQRETNPSVSTVAPRPLELGFNFAAINLVDAADSRIENVRIDGWPSDGISMQRGGGNTVTRCVVERCRGEGYHPGGGLHDSLFTNALARRNIANGFFFCARVARVTVQDNQFIANGRSGVGNLGASGDIENVVERNLCEANGMSGIELSDGQGNTVKDNTCLNNSQGAPGRWSGIWLSATSASTVSGNRCLDTQEVKTQKHGIEELANCHANVIADNECLGNKASDQALAARPSEPTAAAP